MKKRILSILMALCMVVCLIPTTVYAVSDVTKNSAKTNFGVTNEKVDYVYLNDQGAYKVSQYPHFINADKGIYHIHGRLDMNNKIPNLTTNFPNNIEIKAGGTVKLLFDGALDGEQGLYWDYSALDRSITGISNQYSMIKVKNGESNKPTNVEIHFSGKCVITAPKMNAAINSYGSNCHVTIVLHDDCDVTLRGGRMAAAIGGSSLEEGRNITIKTDGKYDANGNRISYKANGKLTCYGGDQAAAIGSSSWRDADNITIESGIVYAYAYSDGRGAGIGTGTTNPNVGGETRIARATNISIKGGTVVAVGDYGAAGIGGGEYSPAENISITGGRVEASGGYGAAGIGGGYHASAKNITVSGGNVKATLNGNSKAYPIGRGAGASASENVTLRLSDNTVASFATKLRSSDVISNRYYSLDQLDMSGSFGYFADENNVALGGVEINFEECKNHDLRWETAAHYQYCAKCQSVKAYDDAAATLTGINDTVLTGSWVTFESDDVSDTGSKSIQHRYMVNREERSVTFSAVPRVAAGIKNVKVETFTYDSARGTHSVLSDTQTLTADSGTKTYRFRGANAYDEYMAYQKAQTNTEKLAALKMQRVTITDNAGNQTTRNVYALLSHRIECYVDGVKQIIDQKNQKDYLDMINGSDLKLTFLKEESMPLPYQYFYEVKVNGNRIPTTEDNVYEFRDIQEDLTVHINRKLDETAPQLTVKVNDDVYKSSETGNDRAACKELDTGAVVTLSAEDIAPEGYPASGVKESAFAYLIAESSMTEEELKNADGWTKYTGPFALPDSKTSIVYARVQDIAGNTVYAATAPYLPDNSAPTIAGLEQDKVYCGVVRFTASDSNGIDTVKAGDTVLTPDDDGKYTLAAGLGTVTVTVTDKAGHTTSVSVTVNAGHTADDDDGDCTTAVSCVICRQVVIPARTEHAFGAWTPDNGHTHTRKCTVNGCTAGVETGDCIDVDVRDHMCDLCGKILSEHSGGEATCVKKAVCEICEKDYGELDAENHSNLKHFDAVAATSHAAGNIEYWYCSGCGRYFSDALAKTEISKDDTITAKLPDTPKTGDASRPIMWIALMIASGVCAATELIRRKASRRH